jgi:hypothetical protein
MDYTDFIRADDLKALEENWTAQQKVKGTRNERDYMPVVKVFNPMGSATFLITEKDPEGSLCFGIADLGFGSPEIGYVCLEEILSVELPGGLRMEQDKAFRATQTLKGYADEARKLQYLKA